MPGHGAPCPVSLLEPCLWQGRAYSGLSHHMEIDANVWKIHCCLCLKGRTAKTKFWEAVEYLLTRCYYIKTKCYNSISCWFPVMWNACFCGERNPCKLSLSCCALRLWEFNFFPFQRFFYFFLSLKLQGGGGTLSKPAPTPSGDVLLKCKCSIMQR